MFVCKMSDENKPDPLDDLRKGLGLLFRAAQNTVSSLPSTGLEKVIATGAEEVKRAFVNVGQVIEREMRGATDETPKPPPEGSKNNEANEPKPQETQVPSDSPPDQVRIAKDDEPPRT